MWHRIVALHLLLVLAPGCSIISTTPHQETPPEPQQSTARIEHGDKGAVPAGRHLPVIVTEAGTAYTYSVGDTLTIDLAGDPNSAGFPIVEGGRVTDRVISIGHVGRKGPGRMVVTASTLNVRPCPSTNAKCAPRRQLQRGDRVEVAEFVDGWYQLTGSSPEYVSAQLLVLPEAYSRELQITARTALEAFYHEKLRDYFVTTANAAGPLFGARSITIEGSILKIQFSSMFYGGPAMYDLCDGLAEVADFAEDLVRRMSADGIRGYSAEVTYRGSSDMVLAYVGADGGVYCTRP